MSWHHLPRWRRAAAWAAVWLTIVGLAGPAVPSHAQAGRGADLASDQADELVAALHLQVASILTVPDDLVLDADLRAAAEALAARELPRMRQVLVTWLAAQPADWPWPDKVLALRSRVYNEFGLWMLDRDGPEHDRRLQRALARPRSCDFIGPNRTVYGMMVQSWQQVPPDQRAALLASEARLLGRWGTARPMAPVRPAEAVSDRVSKVFARHVDQGTALPHPLPPITAWPLFAESEQDRKRPEEQRRCLARQWGLQLALVQGQGRVEEADWVAHLYDRVPDAREWFRLARDEDKADEYPLSAATLRVEGEVNVVVRTGPDGKPLDARIDSRDIKVFGITGQRAVVFETLLDDTSLRRASAMSFAPSPAGSSTVGGEFRLPMAYVLK